MRRVIPMSVLAGCLVLLSAHSTVIAQRRGPLFSEPDGRAGAAGAVVERRGGGAIVRSRTARADLGLLTVADRVSGLTNSFATSLDLNFFEDANFVGQLERVEDFGPGRFAWIGSLIGVPEGRAILAVSDGVLAGSVTTINAAYEIRWQPGGLYEIQQVDRSLFKREAEPLRVDPADLESARGDVTSEADDGSTFDLMVAYTSAARAGAGGTSAINSLIALGVSETNQAYATIGLGARLRLVDTFETSYVETGIASVELSNIRASSSVASRRNAVGADLVMLVVNRLSDACGIGYQMTTLSTSFASNAYTVVDRGCISPNYSFGHELGHNMGSHHAPEDSPGAALFSYSYGYKNSSAGFRTIMAYNCTPSCRRLLTFSTPSLTFNGRPVGTSSQDNARSLAAARTTVANFRQTASSAAPGAPTALTTSASGSTVFLSWTAPASGVPTAYIIEAGSGPGLTNLANFSTGNTATTFSAGGVGAGAYYVRVRSTNSAGTSAPSNESLLTVGGGCTAPPPAPTVFTLTGNSGGTVSFSWGASASATTYVIEAGSTPGATNLANANLGSSATSATFTGLGRGTYYVRLRAQNACGTSGVSNEVTLIVP